MPDGVATWSTTFAVMELLLDSIRADLGDLKTGVGGDFDNVGALLVALRADIEAIKNEIGLLDIPPDAMPDVGTLKTDVAALKTNVSTLQTSVSTLQTNVTGLQSRMSTAEGNVTGLQSRMSTAESNISNLQGNVGNLFQITDALQTGPEPISFVFGGVPAVNSMINVPLTRNLSITPANLSTNSRYHNNINPSSGTTTFQLRRMPANTLIGAFNVTAGTGAITWTNTTGSTVLAAGDTLRMTATAVGPDVTDVAITIHATRRA